MTLLSWALAALVLLATIAALAARALAARRRRRLPPELVELQARRQALRARLEALARAVPERPSLLAAELPATPHTGEIEAALLAGDARRALSAAEQAVAASAGDSGAHVLLAQALLLADALVPAAAEVARARELGADNPLLDHIEGRVLHLLWIRRVNPGRPEVQTQLTPPLVTPFDRLVLKLMRQRRDTPDGAPVWLTGESREHELSLDPEEIVELVREHHEITRNSLELLLRAAERAPGAAELVYHAARRALQLGLVREGRALFERLPPLMAGSPELAAFERDRDDLAGKVDELPPEDAGPPLPPIAPGARRSPRLTVAK